MNGDSSRTLSLPAWNVKRTWSLIFFIALILYALTANRGVQWQDSGWALIRMMEGQTVSPLGLALSHPLHHWLGRFAIAILGNVMEPAFAVTLLSSLFGAIAVANVFGCVQYATGSRSAGWFAAGSLFVAHTFWKLSTITESYTLGAALFSAEIWCLIVFTRTGRSGGIVSAFLFNGLGISNHMLASLSTPVLAVVLLAALMRKRLKFAALAACAGAWIAGSGLYIGLIIAQIVRGGDLGAVLRSAFFGEGFAKDVLNPTVSGSSLLRVAGFIALSFPNLCIPFGAVGMVRARFPQLTGLRRAMLAMLCLHLVFVMRFSVQDPHTFLLHAFVLLTVFAGLGFAWAEKAYRQGWPQIRALAVVMLLMTPGLYAFTPALARRFQVLGGMEHKKPYRDDYVYVFTPWSFIERSADRMGRHAVSLAGTGTDGVIIVEERMAEFAVRYWVIRSGAAISVVRDASDPAIGRAAQNGSPIVLVPVNRDEPKIEAPVGTWRREGDLYASSP